MNKQTKEFKLKKINKEIKLSGCSHFTNEIKTTKYRLWNFLPLSIFYQFYKVPNIYFLILSIIQSIPVISPLHPLTTVIPFLFVLLLSLIKEYIEDISRFFNNLEINNSPCILYRNNNWNNYKYKEIRNGDIIKIKGEEFIPADVLILSNRYLSKETYIETSSLDGEKNMKPKYFIDEINKHFSDEKTEIEDFEFNFISSKPNFNLNNMNGNIIFKENKYLISNKQFLPRGSKLKDNKELIGLVLFVGHDTKIMLNMITKDNKMSHVEKTLNLNIFFILITQVGLMFLAFIFNYIFNLKFDRFQFQGYKNENKLLLAFYNFFTYMILLNTLIPISIIITLEIARICQALFIYWDIEMNDLIRKIKQRIITVNINEELGQIEYLLSDKTGTLTVNKMVLKYLTIGSSLFELINLDKKELNNLDDIIQLKKGSALLNNKKEKIEKKITKDNETVITKRNRMSKRITNFDCLNTTFPIKFNSLDKKESIEFENEKDFINFFNLIVCCCHDCFLKTIDNKIQYNGESPDEISLLEKLNELGYKLFYSNEKEFKIKIFENETIINKIGIIEFDNDRKCMSVIIKYQLNKNKTFHLILTKGADNSMIERANKNCDIFIKSVENSIENFSNKGFRTLVFGFKILSKNELKIFYNDYTKYNLSKKISDIEKWEYDLNLIGASAVEDKLVPNLDKTIKLLKRANIKIWVLTGDKLETAKQIGFSSLLLDKIKHLYIIKNEIDFDNFINIKIDNEFKKISKKKSIIIEGSFLNKILNKNKNHFFELVRNFKTCIFCRVTPIQKSMIVQFVKDKKFITMAIGDGANDVSMIQKAHVGVGIFGVEGRQAVNNSDFAIPDFTKLERLILHHGRLCYIRITKTILYFFYKNLIFTLPNFWFSFNSGFNGLNFYNEFYISMYNLLFTAFPLGMRSVFEQNIIDYKINKLNKNKFWSSKTFEIDSYVRKLIPFLYTIGQNNKIFSIKIFFTSIMNGVLESLLLFFICIYSFTNYGDDYIISSNSLFNLIIINVNMKLLFKTKFLWIFNILTVLILSIGLYLLIIIIYDYYKTEIYRTISSTNNLTNYLVIILGIGILFILNFFYLILNEIIYPTEISIINEYIKNKSKDKESLKLKLNKNNKKNSSKWFNKY